MTAERTHGTFTHEFQSDQEVPELGSATLIPIQRRVHERQLAAKEREMFDSFVEYCHDNFGVDPRTDDPKHSEAIALGGQAFFARPVQRRIEVLAKISEETGAPMPRIHVIPPAPVERTIRWYYKEFGYNRRSKSDKVREAEDAWLEQFMGPHSPIHASIRLDGEIDEEGNISPPKKIPRSNYFPEILLGLVLERILRVQRYHVAADSIETVLAAYGAWFPQRIGEVLDGRRSVVRTTARDTHIVHHFAPGDILDDLPPDRPQKPLPPR